MDMKFKIRREILSKRDSFEGEKYIDKNIIIYNKLENLINSITTKKIVLGLYYPLKTEPDLFKFSVKGEYDIALPKVNNAEMEYVRYQSGSKLIKTQFGDLCQPAGNQQIVPDIAVVPGVAFDIKGYRLGFGIGHYDRYFAAHTNRDIIKIGTCYDEMLFEQLPRESHDVAMNYIITETNTYKF